MTNTMTYSTREINLDWRIKVYGHNFDGKKLNTLVGCSGLINLIGEELFTTIVNRVYDKMQDKCVCKLRRGLKVTFYARY